MARAARVRTRWMPAILLALLVMVTLPAAMFGFRTYRSLLLLHSAYRLGAPAVSGIRAWMTLRYVVSTYGHVPEAVLIRRLGLPPDTPPDTSVRSLAERAGIPPLQYVQRVQQAVADVAPTVVPAQAGATTSWFGAVRDDFLAAMLAYGYPVLGLTLLLGAIGLPLPTGLSMALAGSLAEQGRMSWLWAGAVAVTASVLGDVVGYGLGRVLGREFLERWGRWLGYTPARHVRVRKLFERWGGVTVLLSRTFVEPLSSVANLLAGAGRFRLLHFVAYIIIGRLIWTSAFLALGYGVGGDLEAATAFLRNLTGFLVCLTLLVALAFAIFGRSRAIRRVRV